MDTHEEAKESCSPLLGSAGLEDLATEKLSIFEDGEDAPLVTLRTA